MPSDVFEYAWRKLRLRFLSGAERTKPLRDVSAGRARACEIKDMRKNSVKNRRINDEVRKSLAGIIRDIKDPRVSPMTSVIEVEVAPDLKNCKVWISVLGSEQDKVNTMKGLKSANGFIRGELAHRVNLRNTPELHFIEDDSIAYGVEMGHRIDEVKAQDAAAEEARRAKGIDINDTSAYVSEEEDEIEEDEE